MEEIGLPVVMEKKTTLSCSYLDSDSPPKLRIGAIQYFIPHYNLELVRVWHGAITVKFLSDGFEFG
jgi:hypothetical protein